jgi:hypothetical protein
MSIFNWPETADCVGEGPSCSGDVPTSGAIGLIPTFNREIGRATAGSVVAASRGDIGTLQIYLQDYLGISNIIFLDLSQFKARLIHSNE